jgi:hypothetical protein
MTYGSVSVDSVVTSSGQTLGAGNATSFKNRIINGGMTIDQRNAGASVTPTNGQYLVDRFYTLVTAASKFTAQRDVGLNSFFNNSLRITSSSAYSVAAGDVFALIQKIEGFNVVDLGWGTANAKTVTLSFVVNSSLTGTFGGSLMNANTNRAYPFTFSIPVANTATNISVTIPGDTSGTWGTANGTGIMLSFSLGTGTTFSGAAGAWGGSEKYSATGATSVVGTSGATFYITGVQLEVGSAATSFDVRDYGRELIMCQRYYEVFGGQIDAALNSSVTSTNYGTWFFHTTKRSTPSITQTGLAITGTNGISVDAAQWYGPVASLLRITSATASSEL